PAGFGALRGVLTKIAHVDRNALAVTPGRALALSDRHPHDLHGDMPKGPAIGPLQELEPDDGQLVQGLLDLDNATRCQRTRRVPADAVIELPSCGEDLVPDEVVVLKNPKPRRACARLPIELSNHLGVGDLHRLQELRRRGFRRASHRSAACRATRLRPRPPTCGATRSVDASTRRSAELASASPATGAHRRASTVRASASGTAGA